MSSITKYSVDSCDDSLRCSLLISGCSIDLAGKIEVGNDLRAKRMVELCRIKIIIFDGVGWTQKMDVLETIDMR